MAIKTYITDPSNGNRAAVSSEGNLQVTIHPHPPVSDNTHVVPFRQYFTTTGVASGSNDMRVNGATTNVNFSINANGDEDIFIKTVSILITDAGARLNLFGALAALTNGLSFEYVSNDTGRLIIQDGIKTNLDLVRTGLGNPSIGDGTTAFRADVSGGGADAYLPVIDLQATFGLPWGLHLRKGTKDQLRFVVKDNLSAGLDQFDILGFGTKV